LAKGGHPIGTTPLLFTETLNGHQARFFCSELQAFYSAQAFAAHFLIKLKLNT
jgi:hypothetical protein